MRKPPLPIVYEDRDFVVIDKPAGLLTTHTRVVGRAAREGQLTAENLLNDWVKKGQAKSRARVWLVHRLDRETSGVMMFAKSEALADRIRDEWNSITEKRYIARVEGELADDKGVFESYLRDDPKTMKVSSVANPKDGKFARTEWRKLSVERGTSLVEVFLKSGRKNQIRVHFSEAGHPVVGDVKYGAKKASRLYLHSAELRFRDPTSGRSYRWTSQTSGFPESPKQLRGVTVKRTGLSAGNSAAENRHSPGMSASVSG
ncbi:MAG: RNA pseudouridine synthase [Kiritimatiellae bacterium]|nr:RNA pseudouridine synthase [Kiritimatiellia bacterium]